MKLLISDIKSIVRVPVLLCALISPVLITLFLLFGTPLIYDLTGSENSENFESFYSVTAIALISAIPFIYGLLFSFLHLHMNNSSSRNTGITVPRSANTQTRSAAVSAILSLIVILPVIYLTDPVSTEGWLRSIFAAMLLSATAPFIFLLLVAFGASRSRWTVISIIAVMFLLTVPSGMVLHHPWNYFAFFSPYYWSGWAWVINSPSEGLIYGAISVGITATGSLVFFFRIRANEKRG